MAKFSPSPTAAISTDSGTYTGDGTDNRNISHSLRVIPKVVFITDDSAGNFYRIFTGIAYIYYLNEDVSGKWAVSVMSSSNFYVGNSSAPYGQAANSDIGSGRTYRWIAIR